MNIQLRPVVLWLFIIFDLTVSSQVGAAPPASLDFALHLTRLDTPLKLGQNDIDTTVKQIGITSYDISKFPLQPGIAAGYAYISDGDQAATAGMELQGFYLAPALRMVLRDKDAFTATLTAKYLYQRVNDSNTDQAVTMEWQQPQLTLNVSYFFSDQVGLLLGGQYERIDVDEQLTGNINQTLSIQHDATLGYHAGLEFDLDDDGRVGMLLRRAISNGVELFFERQF